MLTLTEKIFEGRYLRGLNAELLSLPPIPTYPHITYQMPDDLSISAILIRLAAVLILVGANAFFVASEFALVASRRTRIQALVDAGDRKAKMAQMAIEDMDRYISGTQLGITLASLALGWIGEPAIASMLDGFFEGLPPTMALIATHGVAVAIAFMIITFLHIVLGELAPKSIAILHPEETSRWIAAPLIGFTKLASPFIWVLNGSANFVLKMLGARQPGEHERVHRPEEIVMLVRQSQESGNLATEDVQMIEGIFQFTEKNVWDVMTPRTQVVGFPLNLTVEESVEKVAEAGLSRFPVYDETLDDIKGIVHAKTILANLKDARFQPVSAIMTEPFFVPGAREVEHLLADMKYKKNHFAVVLDEFGGCAGIVTMEDLLEEIVGEIYDEYDAPEDELKEQGDNVTVPGDTPSNAANTKYDLGIDEDAYQTVGGFVFGTLGHLPVVGDRVQYENGWITVLSMDARRVETVGITKS